MIGKILPSCDLGPITAPPPEPELLPTETEDLTTEIEPSTFMSEDEKMDD